MSNDMNQSQAVGVEMDAGITASPAATAPAAARPAKRKKSNFLLYLVTGIFAVAGVGGYTVFTMKQEEMKLQQAAQVRAAQEAARKKAEDEERRKAEEAAKLAQAQQASDDDEDDDDDYAALNETTAAPSALELLRGVKRNYESDGAPVVEASAGRVGEATAQDSAPRRSKLRDQVELLEAALSERQDYIGFLEGRINSLQGENAELKQKIASTPTSANSGSRESSGASAGEMKRIFGDKSASPSQGNNVSRLPLTGVTGVEEGRLYVDDGTGTGRAILVGEIVPGFGLLQMLDHKSRTAMINNVWMSF